MVKICRNDSFRLKSAKKRLSFGLLRPSVKTYRECPISAVVVMNPVDVMQCV